MKKTIQVFLALLLLVSMSGCGAKKGSKEFAEYTKTLPAIIAQGTSFDINFLFDHPEDYGIKRDVYTLDYMSLKDFKKNNEDMEDKLDELDDYDYETLNKDQKIVYDLLKKQSEDNDIGLENAYYLTTNYFDVNNGMQAQLPMSLWNYEFKNKKSVISFLTVLKDTPSYFKKYVELEKTRQEKGYGMSKTYMKDVIEAFHTINTSDQSYILESTDEKIDAVDFLSNEEKQSYKDDIHKAFKEHFLPAFVQTEKDLGAVKIQKKGEGELSSYQDGKKYYEKMVSETAGVETIEEYSNYLDKQESVISSKTFDLLATYPELKELFLDEDKFAETLTNLHYTDLTSTGDVINYLEEQIATGKDFPKINKLEYQMNLIPDSMKETIQASAAYYVSAFDDISGKDEQMILNSTFDQSTFTTIAHESFPGHMYQHNYFKTVKHDILRDLLSSSTYSEGWATYIEDKACDYSENAGLCHMNSINSQLTYLYVLDLDKQIHYDGISREKAYTFMKENFGISDEEDLSEQYEQLLENPGIFTNYYVGCYNILNLKDSAKKAWGEKYSDYRFNKLLLDLGPLPIDLLKKYSKL